jgi:hypothetical protein
MPIPAISGIAANGRRTISSVTAEMIITAAATKATM